jgi:hypothetical protein
MVRQVVPVDYASQELVETTPKGDVTGVIIFSINPLTDVKYIGTVSLRVKFSDIIQQEEAPGRMQEKPRRATTQRRDPRIRGQTKTVHINCRRKL